MVIREYEGRTEAPGKVLRAPAELVVSDRLDGLFGGLSARKRVMACQLPVTLTIALVVAAAAVFSPETLTNNLFLAALLFHLAIAAACAAVPWARLPAGGFAAGAARGGCGLR